MEQLKDVAVHKISTEIWLVLQNQQQMVFPIVLISKILIVAQHAQSAALHLHAAEVVYKIRVTSSANEICVTDYLSPSYWVCDNSANYFAFSAILVIFALLV